VHPPPPNPSFRILESRSLAIAIARTKVMRNLTVLGDDYDFFNVANARVFTFEVAHYPEEGLVYDADPQRVPAFPS
jgi:hypothetical protein